MKSRIFLIGFMGSGKTTTGAKLARKLSYHFVDMDKLIEETAEMSIPEIFSMHGEEVFRSWERKILLELLTREHLVISTGGGSPCQADHMDIMKRGGSTIYLEMPPKALLGRLIHSRNPRPLIQGKSEKELLEYITTLLDERKKFYQKADYILNGMDPDLDGFIDMVKQQSDRSGEKH